MTWKKIDTDAATEDGAAHAFVAVAVQRNANGYPSQLARSVSHTYERWDAGAQTDGPQVLATHPRVEAGNWYMVDFGRSARQVEVRIRYATATMTESATVAVRYLRSGEFVEAALPASTTVTQHTMTLTLNREVSGVQPLWVGFVSDVAGSPDTYPPSVIAASGSQIFGYQPASGAPWSGRTAKLLVMPDIGDTSTDATGIPAEFFVGYSAPAPQFDAGSDVGLRMDVWPDVETQPAALPYLEDVTKSAFAATYDLGVVYLHGIAFAVTAAVDDTYTPGYAHDGMSAAGMLSYQTQQRVAAGLYGYTLALAPSPTGNWHARLMSPGDTEERICTSRNKYSRIRCGVMLIANGVVGDLPLLRLEVFDGTGTLLASEDQLVAQYARSMSPRRQIAAEPGSSLTLANMSHTPGDWGMSSLSGLTDPRSVVSLSVDVISDVGLPLVVRFTYDPDLKAGLGMLYGFGLTAVDLVEEGV
jgi:hypothetical protein